MSEGGQFGWERCCSKSDGFDSVGPILNNLNGGGISVFVAGAEVIVEQGRCIKG
jgi:hypothetical protein